MKMNFLKLFLSFLVLLILNSVAHGQDSPRKSSRWSIGFVYNRAQNTYNIFEETKYGNFAVVKSHTAHNFGLNSSYQLSNHFSFRAGVGLGDYGYDMEYSGGGFDKGLYKYDVSYLDIPVDLCYVLNPSGTIQFIISTGFSPSFFLYKHYPYYATGHVQIKNKYFDNFDLYSKVLFGLNAGMGVKYNYSRKVSLAILPFGKIVLNKNTFSSIPGDNEWTHFSSIGFRIDLAYKFQ
jgi:hypothetical protein